MSDIAIIGIGCMFPDAKDLKEYWQNLLIAHDAIRPIPLTHWRPDDYFSSDPKAQDKTYAQTGGFLRPYAFDPLRFGISPTAIEATDTSQLLGMVVAHEAMHDAGYGLDRDFDRDRTSCIMGVTGTLELVIPLGARLGHPKWREALAEAGVAREVADDVIARIQSGYASWQEASFPGLLGNVVAGRIASRLNLGGTNCVVDAACASSLSAMHLAMMELKSKSCDMVLTGGVDTFNDIFMYMCFSKTPALSPSGHARPFASDSDGTSLGEGIGALVLKRLEDAERDGDRIYAVITGMGTSSDGKGQAIYAPAARGQVKALKRAYAASHTDPNSIGLIEAHGTGTKVGDATELQALKEVYGDAPQQPTIGSVKSQIGHTKAAAGVAGIIKATMALYHKVLPPTLKIKEPLAELAASAFVIRDEAQPWINTLPTPRRAAVSAFGFGGSNFHCVLEEYAREKPSMAEHKPLHVIPLSADSPAALSKTLATIKGVTDKEDALAHACQKARREFSATAQHRLVVIVGKKPGELNRVLDQLLSLLEQPDLSGASWPAGCYYGQGIKPGALALLFSGQGSQYPGMLRELGLYEGEFFAALQRAEHLWPAQDPKGHLRHWLTPPRHFSGNAEGILNQEMARPDRAQACLAAVEAGLIAVLSRYGLQADAVAGHSFGELSALHAAGVWSQDDFLKASFERGKLLASEAQGSMLAIQKSASMVAPLLQGPWQDLVIANDNAPEQVVIAGASDTLQKFAQTLASQGITCRKLNVGAAFHSPLVQASCQPFADFINKLNWQRPKVAVYSNTCGGRYPEQSEEIVSILRRQIAEPVRFQSMVKSMLNDGIKTLVEVGPQGKIKGLLRSIVAGTPGVNILAVEQGQSREALASLLRTIGQLAALGYSVSWSAWDEDHVYPAVAASAKRHTIEITGANYFQPKVAPGQRPARDGGSSLPTPSQPEQQRPGHGPAAQSLARPDPAPERAAVLTATNKHSTAPALVHAPSPAPVLQSISQKQKTTTAIHYDRHHLRGLPMSHEHEQGAWSSRGNEHLLLLQKMQEANARLHQTFLDNQRHAQETFRELLNLALAAPAPITRAVPELPTPSSLPSSAKPAVAPPYQATAQLAMPKAAPVLQAPQLAPKAPSVRRSPPDPQAITPSPQGTPAMPAAVNPPLASGSAKTADTFDMVRHIVADKTGYPVEMLTETMSLESDLGIDSIKRVEILAALAEKEPAFAALGPDDLARLSTLGDFGKIQSAATPRQGAETKLQNKSPKAAPHPDKVESSAGGSAVLAVIADKTGYPLEMLAATMELEADLGIDSIKRVEIMAALSELNPNASQAEADSLAKLRTIADVQNFFYQDGIAATTSLVQAATPTSSPQAEDKSPQALMAYSLGISRLDLAPMDDLSRLKAQTVVVQGPSQLVEPTLSALAQLGVNGQKHQSGNALACADSTNIAGLIILAPDADIIEGSARAALGDAFLALQEWAPILAQKPAGQSFVAAVSANGGRFNIDGTHPNPSPHAQAWHGLIKTLALEASTLDCYCLDLEAIDARPELWTKVLGAISMTTAKDGALELGIAKDHYYAPSLSPIALPKTAASLPFNSADRILITGGARGITAKVAVELARLSSAELILVGSSPLPEALDPELEKAEDDAAIKRILNGSGRFKSPQALAEAAKKTLAAREILRTLATIKTMGKKVRYISCDLRRSEAVASALRELAADGPITGLVHAAGVLHDRLLVDKKPTQFMDVYDTKVSALEHLLAVLDLSHLRFVSLFSSSTARFGRKGQCDYAAANEVLSKYAAKLRLQYPKLAARAFCWGPWDGGMVNPGLKELFHSEGVGIIPLLAGAAFFWQQALIKDEASELVVLGPESKPPLNVRQPQLRPNPMSTRGPTLHSHVSVDTYPVLRSHVIGGRAVVPSALMLDWLASAALGSSPSSVLHKVEDFRVLKGVTLDSKEGVSIEATASVETGKAASSVLGESRLKTLLTGVTEHGKKLKVAAATFTLNSSWPKEALPSRLPSIKAGKKADIQDSYERVLFHGPMLKGLKAIIGVSAHGIEALAQRAPAPSDWLERPYAKTWSIDPLAIDCALQLVILWTEKQHGLRSLPCGFARYQQFQTFPEEFIIRVAIKDVAAARVLADVEFLDSSAQLIASIDDYASVMDAKLAAHFQDRQLKSKAKSHRVSLDL